MVQQDQSSEHQNISHPTSLYVHTSGNNGLQMSSSSQSDHLKHISSGGLSQKSGHLTEMLRMQETEIV